MTNYYWHFAACDEDGVPRLGYGDGREIKIGETLTVECEPELCEVGLHASRRLVDALGYIPNVRKLCLCRVTLGGTVLHDDDKSVGTERTVVAMLDADTTNKLLRDFARWCALSVAHLWDMPDIVRQYLETGDEPIRDAARAAARAAAWAAARDAARDAAWDAAWAAAGDAARDAAWDAAWAAGDAAWDAARDAARDAAWAAGDAARDAAWDAAWAAAWDAARAAAWDAARAAAWAAARDAARDAARAAAWDAARDAARDAAWDIQNIELERRALALIDASYPAEEA